MGILCPVTRRQASITSVRYSRAHAQVALDAMFAVTRWSRPDVRRAKIVDVNVIANAGAVRRGIVLAKHRDRFALAQRHLQHQGIKCDSGL